MNIGSGRKISYFTRMNIGSNIKIRLSGDIRDPWIQVPVEKTVISLDEYRFQHKNKLIA